VVRARSKFGCLFVKQGWFFHPADASALLLLFQALLTAELGTTFPEAGAGVAWVEEAFGPSAGWMCGYLGWIAGGTVLICCAMPI
jgi:amino acid transporter